MPVTSRAPRTAGHFGGRLRRRTALARRARRDRDLRPRARRRDDPRARPRRRGRPAAGDAHVDPPFGAGAAPTAVVQFVTEKGGSTFRCGLDGAPLAPCCRQHAMTKLADGPHVLRVAGDRPLRPRRGDPGGAAVRRRHAAAAHARARAARLRRRPPRDRRRWAPTSRPRLSNAASPHPGQPEFFPGAARRFLLQRVAAPATTSNRGRYLRVRAVDVAGNRDPIGTRSSSRRRVRASPGPSPACRPSPVHASRSASSASSPRGSRHAVRMPHRRRAVGALPVRVSPADPARGSPHAAGPPAPGGHEHRHDHRTSSRWPSRPRRATRRSSACRWRS